MQEIILLKGLPASGKTTWAKEFMKSHEDYIRVNKDDIRTFFRITKYSSEGEKKVVETEYFLGEMALNLGKSLIVDDTNFNQKYCSAWLKLAVDRNIKYSENVFDTSVSECIKRDSEREKSVGKDVILRIAKSREELKKLKSEF